MQIKDFEIEINGDYVSVYNAEGEIIYNDEWISEDFDIWAKLAVERGIPFTDFLYQAICDNIEVAKELEEE